MMKSKTSGGGRLADAERMTTPRGRLEVGRREATQDE